MTKQRTLYDLIIRLRDYDIPVNHRLAYDRTEQARYRFKEALGHEVVAYILNTDWGINAIVRSPRGQYTGWVIHNHVYTSSADMHMTDIQQSTNVLVLALRIKRYMEEGTLSETYYAEDLDNHLFNVFRDPATTQVALCYKITMPGSDYTYKDLHDQIITTSITKQSRKTLMAWSGSIVNLKGILDESNIFSNIDQNRLCKINSTNERRVHSVPIDVYVNNTIIPLMQLDVGSELKFNDLLHFSTQQLHVCFNPSSSSTGKYTPNATEDNCPEIMFAKRRLKSRIWKDSDVITIKLLEKHVAPKKSIASLQTDLMLGMLR